MRLRTIILSTLLLLCGVPRLFALTAINDWTIYPSFFTPQQIEESEDYIFYTSNGYLYYYDKESEEMFSIDKKAGLSDTEISFIRYDNTNDILFIAYTNSNIDLYQNGVVYNLPDLKNKVLSSSKTINQVTFNGSKAYIATDFGVLHLNLSKKELTQTYDFGTVTNVAALYNDSLYVSFGDTLKSMYSEELRWFNDTAWHDTGLIGVTNIIEQDSVLYLHCNSTYNVYKIKEGVTSFLTDYSMGIKKAKYGVLSIRRYGSSLYKYYTDEKYYTVSFTEGSFTDVASYNDDNIFWGLNSKGITSGIKAVGDTEITYVDRELLYHTHNVDVPYYLSYADGYLYVNNSGPNCYTEAQSANAYLSVLDDYGNWTHVFPDASIPISRRVNVNIYGLNNLYNVSPVEGEAGSFYVGTWFEGMYKFTDLSFDRYYNENSEYGPSYSNSSTTAFSPSNYVCKLNGQTFDEDGNLWMLYFSTTSDPAIHVLSPEGTWTSLTYPDVTATQKHFEKIVISKNSYNLKWIVNSLYVSGYIFVFDDKGTIGDTSDDETKLYETFVDQDGTSISPYRFYCAVEDNDGEIWVGCDKGLLVLNSLSNIFSDNYNCQRIKIARDDGSNYADILLDNIPVSAIVVDGANRKWIGTLGGGLYLVSESGETIVNHFTNSNSYLPSNNIVSLALNGETGEVYIGTDQGLVSYRSDATNGETSYNEVYAYPNPVHTNYNGVVTITGLKESSLVKIFSVSGSQVYQGISNGGTITWDTNSMTGSRVQSGVYLVYASSSDGSDGVVTKILIMK